MSSPSALNPISHPSPLTHSWGAYIAAVLVVKMKVPFDHETLNTDPALLLKLKEEANKNMANASRWSVPPDPEP